MNREQFLDLTALEQKALILESGVLLISFDKGDTSISFHRLNHFFVKTISKDDGYRHVEVHTSQKVFDFSEFGIDPDWLFARRLFANMP